MGIGSTVKNMLSTDLGPSANATVSNTDDRAVDTGNTNAPYEVGDSNVVGDRTSRQLPPGIGPGTSGKPAVAEKSGLERSRTGQDTSGYGTDAAAAMGGTLAGTHQGISGNNRTVARNTSGSSTAAGVVSDAAAGSRLRDSSMSGDQGTTGGQAASATKTDAVREPTQGLATGVGRGGFLEDEHDFGHTMHDKYIETARSKDNTSQLHPVVHEKVRHLEFEEIAHVKDRERHILHVQHHTQPVIVSEELQERLRDYRRPVIRVNEVHANKPNDSTIFQNQIYQNRDSVSHIEKERKVIDKGTVVNETVHHHIHHVIQPVIEKETIERERIRTTVPIHEVTHEAPVVHQPEKHAPIPIEEFLRQGGILNSGVPQDEIIRKVLHIGKCTREIDGGVHSPSDMNETQTSVAGPKN